jgi:glycosyltransferase involved in cell wall biosynthesis
LKISIITVTYNSQDTLEETILSVLNQDYPEIEYIIVDGMSTDGTADIIRKYRERIGKFVSEKDNGLYDAMNKGINMATGEVIGFLHSDDFYANHQVISRYAQLFDREKCDAVYSDLYYVSRNDTSKVIRKWKSGTFTPGAFLNGWMPPHPTFFARKKIFDLYGGFDPALKSAADYELMLRFIEKNGIRISYLPEFTVKMRVGGKSNVSLKNRVNANREDRLAWKMNGLKPRFYTLYLKPFRKIFQYLIR